MENKESEVAKYQESLSSTSEWVFQALRYAPVEEDDKKPDRHDHVVIFSRYREACAIRIDKRNAQAVISACKFILEGYKCEY